MKISPLLAAAALCACLVGSSAAETAAAPAPAAPAAESSSPAADLQALVGRIKAKLRQGERTEAALAPELAAFDALGTKYKGVKTDASAMIPFMKATLYLEVLNEPEKGLPILAQIQADFPGTHVAALAARSAKMASIQPLAAGSPAPDFTATDVGGGTTTITLSQLKGKIVILDFWSTWCGPCQRSLPHVEKVFQNVRDKDVVVLGVCSWDAKDNYRKWLPAHKDFTFTLAMDPAERNGDQSIATKLYGVTGIPTTYVIGRDGKVAAAIVGFGGDTDRRIEQALEKLGVKA